MQQRRDKVATLIKHFNPIKADGTIQHPEEYIHDAIILLDERDNPYPEVINKSKSILAVVNHHEYISKLIEQGITLDDIINTFSMTNQWSQYVQDLKT